MSIDELKTRFQSLEPSLRRLEEEARFILGESVRQSSIRIHSLLSRVKSLESFLEKMARKSLSDPFDTINDLVGVRVVCLFRSDIQKLGEIVHDQFEVITEDNKLDGTVDVFGYQSVHFVTRIKSSHIGPRYQGLHDLRAEIQLRTVAMDTWATLSHYLDYKTEPDVPRDLRKDFFALSGLFYVADTHFELFYQARQRAKAAASEEATSTPTMAQELNLDTFSAYLAKRYPDREHSTPADQSELLAQLTKVGYTNLGQLHSILEESANVFSEYESASRPSNSPFSDVGAVRISVAIVDPTYFKEMRYGTNHPLLELRKKLRARI